MARSRSAASPAGATTGPARRARPARTPLPSVEACRLIASVGTALASAHSAGRGLRPSLVGECLSDLRSAYALVAAIAASRSAR